MTKTLITAPYRRSVLVEVYEPRQSPEQDEVILDSFELQEGASEEYDLRSATAAYRFKDLPSDRRQELSEEVRQRRGEFVPDQEPGEDGLAPTTEDEIKAGQSRTPRKGEERTTKSRAKREREEAESPRAK